MSIPPFEPTSNSNIAAIQPPYHVPDVPRLSGATSVEEYRQQLDAWSAAMEALSRDAGWLAWHRRTRATPRPRATRPPRPLSRRELLRRRLLRLLGDDMIDIAIAVYLEAQQR